MSSEICGSLNLEQNQGSMYPVPAVPEPGGCVFCGNGVDCVGDGLIQSFGLASLARKTRPDHGARKVVSEPMKRAIEGLALESHAIPITSVHRQIKEYAEAVGDTVPSYWIVCDIVREVPPSLRTLAHQGAKAYGESFDLIHRQEASKPNSIWQADHAPLDIKLLKEDGSAARP